MEKIYTRPRFRKLNPNEYLIFWESLRDARKINKHGDHVLLREKELYKDSQNFLIGNGIAGFAIMDYELVSVHKNNKRAQESNIQHILPKMVRCAFKYDARFCDCYGEFLANYYSRSGFIAIAKINFNDLNDNPPDWDFQEHGEPMVYILIRGVKNIAELDKLKNLGQIKGFDAVKDYIPQFKTMDDCCKYRDEFYEKIKNLSYKNRLLAVKNSGSKVNP